MKPIENSNDIVRSFEIRVFRYGMIVAFIFRLIRSIHEYLIDSPSNVLLIGVFNLVLIAFLFLICRKMYLLASSVFYTQVLFTSILTWNNAGGWNGSVPYIFAIIVVAIIITSHGLFQVIALSAYGLIIILLNFSPYLLSLSLSNSNYSNLSREVDFLVCVLVLIFFTLYLKNNFFSFRESVELSNSQLRESSRTLAKQTEQLKEQQNELNAIRNNLEEITSSKINEAQHKAEKLKEYAFINAHHVRGPLARVLGLIYLIEMENPDSQKSAALKKIKTEAQEMDTIIGKINEIIS